MTWEAPKTFYKGLIVPEVVRSQMKEGDQLGLRGKNGIGHWSINGQLVVSEPLSHPVRAPEGFFP